MKLTSASYIDFSWICGNPFIISKVLNDEYSTCRQALGKPPVPRKPKKCFFPIFPQTVGSQKAQNKFSSNISPELDIYFPTRSQ